MQELFTKMTTKFYAKYRKGNQPLHCNFIWFAAGQNHDFPQMAQNHFYFDGKMILYSYSQNNSRKNINFFYIFSVYIHSVCYIKKLFKSDTFFRLPNVNNFWHMLKVIILHINLCSATKVLSSDNPGGHTLDPPLESREGSVSRRTYSRSAFEVSGG